MRVHMSMLWVFICLGGLLNELPAQQTPQATVQSSDDRTDSLAFAILFRRENVYVATAHAAKSPEDPQAQLMSVLPTKFGLDSFQAATFEHLAIQWSAEIKPVRTQLVATIAQFHNSFFPRGHLSANIDPTPPADIRVLRTQLDQITLRYRDQLRNSMSELAYQSLQAKVRQAYGKDVDVVSKSKAAGDGGAQ